MGNKASIKSFHVSTLVVYEVLCFVPGKTNCLSWEGMVLRHVVFGLLGSGPPDGVQRRDLFNHLAATGLFVELFIGNNFRPKYAADSS